MLHCCTFCPNYDTSSSFTIVAGLGRVAQVVEHSVVVIALEETGDEGRGASNGLVVELFLEVVGVQRLIGVVNTRVVGEKFSKEA